MAGQWCSRRQYIINSFLVFAIGLIIFNIYIVTEYKLGYDTDSTEFEKAQKRLLKKTVLLQKIEQAVGHPSVQKHSVQELFDIRETMSPLRNTGDKLNDVYRIIDERKEKVRKDFESAHQPGSLNSNVHLFYYLWWGNPRTDGKYLHWNHKYIPHWRKEEAVKWPTGVHAPPEDIGANFYPALGPYSSADSWVIEKHMEQIQLSGAGVIVVSWYPLGQNDENGQPVDPLIPQLLDIADKYGIKVAFHIEPYQNRSGQTLYQHVKYIVNSYGHHPAYFRKEVKGKLLPVYYIYDSYQIDSALWAEALKPGGKYCLRDTKYDGIFLGLYLGPTDKKKIITAGFDGFYTYFAANGFSEGSTWLNWKSIAKFAAENHLMFIPSVGPGYVDTRIRPWNAENTRKRLHGKYFRQAFQAALDTEAQIISVTSFNEWHEGTQVEPAVPKTVDGYKYEDYSPNGQDYYLLLLKKYVDKFTQLSH